jgi:hypothetical protein
VRVWGAELRRGVELLPVSGGDPKPKLVDLQQRRRRRGALVAKYVSEYVHFVRREYGEPERFAIILLDRDGTASTYCGPLAHSDRMQLIGELELLKQRLMEEEVESRGGIVD